jgi:hypothetical protein
MNVTSPLPAILFSSNERGAGTMTHRSRKRDMRSGDKPPGTAIIAHHRNAECSQVAVKPATQNSIAFRLRVGPRSVVVGLALVLAGCSSGDYAAAPVSTSAAAPVVVAPAQPPTVMRSDLPPPAHTGADGYPNVNVDTASPTSAQVRTVEERDRLEAELMALGERQRSSAGGTPQSVVQELKELGRRSKAEALQLIESGKAPDQP